MDFSHTRPRVGGNLKKSGHSIGGALIAPKGFPGILRARRAPPSARRQQPHRRKFLPETLRTFTGGPAFARIGQNDSGAPRAAPSRRAGTLRNAAGRRRARATK